MKKLVWSHSAAGETAFEPHPSDPPLPLFLFLHHSFQGALLLRVFVSFGGTPPQSLHRERAWPGLFVAGRFSGSVASPGTVGVWLSTGGTFAPQGTFDNVCRHFWL